MQAAAKQKYARRDPLKLGNYFIGQRLNASEAVLHQNAFSIADLLTPETGTDLATARDRLPGIGIDFINDLRAMMAPAGAAAPAAAPGELDYFSCRSAGLARPPCTKNLGHLAAPRTPRTFFLPKGIANPQEVLISP